jgi:hypothetical protein
MDKNETARAATRAVQESNSSSHDYSTRPVDDPIGKAAAVTLYNHNILGLDAVQRMFDRNPAWRPA